MLLPFILIGFIVLLAIVALIFNVLASLCAGILIIWVTVEALLDE